MSLLATALLVYILPCTTLNVPVAFTAGPPSAQSTLTANPNIATADGNSTMTLTLRARDAFNNPVKNASATLSASGSSNVFGTTTLVCDANGQATTTLATSLVQNKTVIATFTSNVSVSVSVSTNVSFVVGPANSAMSSFVASPASQVADGNSIISATLTLRDAQGRPINNATVTATASGISTTVGSNSGPTNTSGVRVPTYQTTVAQNENAIVSVSGLTFTAPLIFVPGPASLAQSSLVASPNSQVADANAAINLTVTLADAQGNSIPNQRMAFASGGTASAFTTHFMLTDASGKVFNALRSPFAGADTLFALGANLILSTPINFTTRTAYCTGTPTFNVASIGVGTNYNVMAADFNRDSFTDVAIVNAQGASIFFNVSNGNFTTPLVKALTTNGASDIRGIDHGDFNNDGFEDIVATAQGDSDAGFYVYFGNGDGSMQVPVYYSLGEFAESCSAAAADYNGDGVTDVAILDNGGFLQVFLGSTSGTLQQFSSPVSFNSSNTINVLATDLNNDGHADFIVQFIAGIAVVPGNGDGTFRPEVDYASTFGTSGLAVGDFDGNGLQDVALAGFEQGATSINGIQIFLNTDGGALSTASFYNTAGSNPITAAIGIDDFNGDGKQDLVYGTSDNKLTYMVGDGSGNFTQKAPVSDVSATGFVMDDFKHNAKRGMVRNSSSGLSYLSYAGCQ